MIVMLLKLIVFFVLSVEPILSSSIAVYVDDTDKHFFRAHPRSKAAELMGVFDKEYGQGNPLPEFRLDELSKRARVLFFTHVLNKKLTHNEVFISQHKFTKDTKKPDNGFFRRSIETYPGPNPVSYVAYIDNKPLLVSFGESKFCIISKVTNKQKGNFELINMEKGIPTDYPTLFAEFSGKDREVLAILSKRAGAISDGDLEEISEEGDSKHIVRKKIKFLNTLMLLSELEISRRYVESDGSMDKELAVVPFGLAIASARNLMDLQNIFKGKESTERIKAAKVVIDKKIKSFVKSTLVEAFGGEDESDEDLDASIAGPLSKKVSSLGLVASGASKLLASSSSPQGSDQVDQDVDERDDFSSLTSVHQALTKTQKKLEQQALVKKLEKIVNSLIDQCNGVDDLMELGSKVYKLSYEDLAGKVFEKIPDNIEEGGFKDVSDLTGPLKKMGFDQIAKEITEINQRGSGK